MLCLKEPLPVILQFEPDIASVPTIQFRPFMIETAYDYFKTVSCSTHERGLVQQTFSVLAIEIVLKSYIARVSGHVGQLDERYEVDKSALPGSPPDLHNLKYLTQALDPGVRSYLLDLADEQEIEEHQDSFKRSRYFYERTAPSYSSDGPLRLAAKLLCKTAFLYKQRGCNDPFIRAFDVDGLYFSVIQPMSLWRSREA